MMQKFLMAPAGVLDGSKLVLARGDKANPLVIGSKELVSQFSHNPRRTALRAGKSACLGSSQASKLERLGIPKTKEKNGKYQVPGQENSYQQEGHRAQPRGKE